jgi:benzoyl-CoA 2,3-dioxygenase component B
MNLYERIPNNVNLAGDKKLQRALESWLPNFLDWWREMGPEGFQDKEVYLRTATSVETDGWANFDFVKMPDYRWGIFLKPAQPDAKIGFGDNHGHAAYQEVPGEFRNSLRRIIVTQGDTEPASVEQQRQLGKTCPSLYDLRNLFQVNVEEGRHLWAMVYLLHGYFGRDGRDEADALLERRSGNPDKPRILEAFNQPCDDWLNFFAFTMFTDRDGKYQLSALAESGFEPLARTCQFMLTEEAHHMFVGDTGLGRVVRRTAQLMKEGDVRDLGGIPLEIIQRYINFWFSYSLDLFGGEISSNSAAFFAAGLKGRYKEQDQYEDHSAANEIFTLTVVENGQLRSRDVPLRNALNEVLRGEYMKDCEKGLARWNKVLKEEGGEGGNRLLYLPSPRFHRHVGEYAGHHFDIEGNLITKEEFDGRSSEWLPTMKDREYVRSLMHPVTEPGKIANWIAPPAVGIKGKPFEFEYVRL